MNIIAFSSDRIKENGTLYLYHNYKCVVPKTNIDPSSFKDELELFVRSEKQLDDKYIGFDIDNIQDIGEQKLWLILLPQI